MSKHWYVVHTYSGHENKVKSNLERKVATLGLQEKICQVIIPMENVAEVKEGKRVTTLRKFFPGYVIVEMELDDQTWEVIRNLPGVSGFIGAGNKPVPLKPGEFDIIKDRMEDKGDKPRPKLKFEKGETVRVIEGPFVNFSGVIEEVNEEKSKLKIVISIFGRPMPLELDVFQVERA
jgi:transcriptional antiterminator NusG